MANIQNLIGYNEENDQDTQPLTNELFAVYGNDVVKVSSGLGYGFNINTSSVSQLELFLNTVFFQNFDSTQTPRPPKTYDVLNDKWITRHVSRCLNAKFMKPYKSRMFLGYCGFSDPQAFSSDPTAGGRGIFPSHAFYSDLLEGANLTWGIEWGTNGKIIPNSNVFELAQPLVQNFVTSNIKVGDPIFFGNISSGAPLGILAGTNYFVQSIPSPYRLIVDKQFPSSVNNAVGISYWVGSNFFRLDTNDGDSLTGFGENSDNLLLFKLMSLWFYNGSQLRKSQNALGTSSQNSVVNSKGYTYYFHGSQPSLSGIYRFDGVASTLVSRPIDPFIQGMNTINYPLVVGWEEGNSIRFSLGDLSNTNANISMTNAVATLNTITNAWSVDPVADIITDAAVFRVNNQQNSYFGTSDNQVMKTNSGNSHNGTPIRMRMETKVYYPTGSETINNFSKIQIIAQKAKGLQVGYKLWNTPLNIDDNFKPLGEITNDKTEFKIPKDHQYGSGIQLSFDDYNILENDAFVEKATIFYKPEMTRVEKK